MQIIIEKASHVDPIRHVYASFASKKVIVGSVGTFHMNIRDLTMLDGVHLHSASGCLHVAA